MDFEALNQLRVDMRALLQRGNNRLYYDYDKFYISRGEDVLIDVTDAVIKFIDFFDRDEMGNLEVSNYISRDIGINVNVTTTLVKDKKVIKMDNFSYDGMPRSLLDTFAALDSNQKQEYYSLLHTFSVVNTENNPNKAGVYCYKDHYIISDLYNIFIHKDFKTCKKLYKENKKDNLDGNMC